MSTLDIFIEKGVKEGRTEKSVEFVKNLLLTGSFSTVEMASLVSVPRHLYIKQKNPKAYKTLMKL